MTLYDDRYQTPGIFGDVSGIPAQVQERKMLAQRLLNNFGEMPKGEMISGHYVAPSWTQQLASALKGPLAMREIAAANKQMGDYNNKKRQDIAAILAGQTPQTVVTGEQKTMPAYTPEQMDRFGSPIPGVERQPVTTQTTQTETPEQVQARLRPLIYAAASQYGNDPALQMAIGDMNYQRQRADARTDKIENREDLQTFQKQQADTQREYLKAQSEENRAQRMQELIIKSQDARLQQQDRAELQRELARMAQDGRMQAAELAAGNRAPIAVQGPDGNAVYVQPNKAVGQRPYTAKQEAADAIKAQQSEQSRISAQQVLDQADALFKHPGRESGTGASSFMSNIPGTDAKGFKANLDTFKAQTFIPMVSALKGMGALSDAEGKKLSESVGALDPSMPEKEFQNSLKQVTKTLYQKAKASGLNVSLPDFAAERADDKKPKGSSGGWSITPVGK
jgi:hypothetical protein